VFLLEYRELGKTGLKVSEIGFGCGNVGGLMIRGSYREQIQAVRRAIELGINYFDTASSYGEGSSETNLGRVMNELQPKNVVVATKVSLQTKDLVDIRSAVQRSLKESLRRLNRESVDVFQLHTQVDLSRGKFHHGTLGVEDVLGVGGVADVFDEAKSKGLIHFGGFTGLGETEALHQIIRRNRFDVVQAYYNLLNPSAGFLVPAGFVGNDFRLLIRKASEKRMGVVVIRVLAGGALGGEVARRGYASTAPGSLTEGADYKADVDRAGKLRFLVADEIKTLPQAAIRFALMNRDVSTVLVGFSNLSQIEEAASCSVEEPFPKNMIKELQGLWSTDFGRR
jgi:L-galactose dehydrogenase/L-glyceraldehyde 3-phosphate reductase